MSLAKKYRKSLEESWCLRLETTHPDEDAFDGVVTLIQAGWIVLHTEVDFEFNALNVFPKRVLRGVRDGEFERSKNAILHHNRQIKRVASPSWLEDCGSLRAILVALRKRTIWPAIETVTEEDGERKSAFFIGPILETRKSAFDLQCYDAEGNWEADYSLSYDEIFRIEIESTYTRHFNAYMRSRSD